MDFYDLDLCDELLDAIDDMRFTSCTPIQEKAIPPVLDGHDLIGIAQTGTGKTAAYLLPVLDRMIRGEGKKNGTCLIMVPTRELCEQIDQQVQGFTYYTDLSCCAIYGGTDGIVFAQQQRAIEGGCDILVATPGRLIAHMAMKYCNLDNVGFLILDEADRMLDMGFHEDIMQIYRQIGGEHPQTLMFSATMPENIRQLTQELLVDPVQVRIAADKPAEGVHQTACFCDEAQKLPVLSDLFTRMDTDRAIIFASTKSKVKDICRQFSRLHLAVDQMHSDLDQTQRLKVMDRFRSRETKILVATDILARGIDIEDIQIVVNYDVPHEPEDYVHRVGRTARAQSKGMSVTMVSPDDRRRFGLIERFLGKKVERLPLPEGMEPSKEQEKEPSPRPSDRSKGRGRPGDRSGHGRRNGKGPNDRHQKKDQAAAPASKTDAKESVQAENTQNAEEAKKRKRGGRNYRRKRKPEGKGGEASGAPQATA